MQTIQTPRRTGRRTMNIGLMTVAILGVAFALLAGPVAVHAKPAAKPSTSQTVQSELQKAGSSSGLTTQAAGAADQQQLPAILGNLVKTALGLLGILLVLLIIYAGYLWMTASGNEEQVTKAKKMLTNAVIGMVIIMAAYAITGFVVGAVLTGTGVGGATPPAGDDVTPP